MNNGRSAPVFTVLLCMSVATVLANCGEDTSTLPLAPIMASVGGSDPSAEGELFGAVFENGQKTSRTDLDFMLLPADAQTWSHIQQPFSEFQWVNPNDPKKVMIEYSYPGADGLCGDLAHYQEGDESDRLDEVHPSAPGIVPSTKESHCIMPGSYTAQLRMPGANRTAFMVDYFVLHRKANGQPLNLTMNPPPPDGHAVSLEAVDQTPHTTGYPDFILHFDLDLNGGWGDTPLLDVENAGGQPAKPTFNATANPSGGPGNWFRFSVARSTSGWPLDSRGQMLTKLYWDYPASGPNAATGYFDAHSIDHKVRIHQYAAADACVQSGVCLVAAELMRPDELPGTSVVTVPIDFGPGSDQTPPSKPTGLTAVAADHSQIDLSWNAASDPESGVKFYRIYRDGSPLLLVTETSYSDLNLCPSTTNTYRVSALNGSGLEGPQSAAKTASTNGAPFVQTVTIAPGPVDLDNSNPTELVEAIPFDASGKKINCTTFNWTIFNTSVATILGSSQGVSSVIVEGENDGTTKIQAIPTIPGKRKRVNVNVNCGGPCF